MTEKPAGRHAEIVPAHGSHFVMVDGKEWARFDTLEKAESLRSTIVARWAQYYEAKTAEIAS